MWSFGIGMIDSTIIRLSCKWHGLSWSIITFRMKWIFIISDGHYDVTWPLAVTSQFIIMIVTTRFVCYIVRKCWVSNFLNKKWLLLIIHIEDWFKYIGLLHLFFPGQSLVEVNCYQRSGYSDWLNPTVWL